MAHEVETMMAAGTVPWHGLGVRVEEDVNSKEALHLAGLDWRVERRPIHTLQAGQSIEIPGFRAIVRQTDNHPLGVVGTRYQPIQNVDAFSFFDGVVGEGQAIYHTAGSLKGGRRVWILAKLPGEIRIGRDDITEKFLLLSNSHDGSAALRMMFTPIRVVCQNTLNIALSRGKSHCFNVRHTASAPLRIDEARKALGLANKFYTEFEDTATRLAASPFSEENMQNLAQQLFPIAPEFTSKRTINIRNKVVELFEVGAGHEPIRGTAWAALNAVAEYTDHHRAQRRNGDGRLQSLWWGSGANIKSRAFSIIEQQLAA